MYCKFTLFITILLFNLCTHAQTKTLTERLGYSKDAKLLIIHSDDIGVTHSENIGSIDAIEKGMVNSGSIMVPCPWFPEIAAYAKNKSDLDLGIHLTLTSEWKYYKWRPLAPIGQVSSLVNEKGFMYAEPSDVLQNAKLEEVEKELRTQIQTALSNGIDVTHLDSHMGTLFYKKEFVELYKKLGKEFNVPVMLNKQDISDFSGGANQVVINEEFALDKIYTANPTDYKKGMENYYSGLIKKLEAGVSIILIHTAYDNAEMQAVTVDHPEWGSAWRQADLDYFTSKACKDLLKKENIQLVTWKEIRDKVVRN